MAGFIAWLWKPSSELSLWGRALRAPFSIAAFFYCIIIKIRTMLFDTGFFKKMELPLPVLVVGNLSAGGTGKTPLAAWLAMRFLEKGKKPALISRGYKGGGSGKVCIVSDGKDCKVPLEESGDEPAWLARNVPGVPVITAKSRFKAGLLAHERYGADCLILDDGFQHLSLARDVDVVLLDSGRALKEDNLVPRGSLREPPDALSRAHVIVMTRAEKPDVESAEYLKKWNTKAPVFFMRYVPESGLPAGKKALAFCGVGSPDYFFKLCENAGAEIVERVVFPDHHKYTAAELAKLEEKASQLKADFLVTTEKDAIKIHGGDLASLPLLVLKVRPDFFGRDSEFFDLVYRLLMEGRE